MEYSFCPKCGGSLNAYHIKTSEPKRLVCTVCNFIFYLDPKVAAAAIFTLNGKIPLLQRSIEPSHGKWVFPGGFVDRGENVEDAAIRETKEECHLKVQILSLLNVYSYAGNPTVLVVYAAEVTGGKLQVGDESLDVQLFSPKEIPWNRLAFPSTKEALIDYIDKFVTPRNTSIFPNEDNKTKIGNDRK